MLDTTRLKAELGHIQADLAHIASGPRGREVLMALRTATELAIPAGKLLWQALHNDALRVVYVALAADDRVVDDEIDATYEYLFSVARHYAEVLPAVYASHAALEPEDARGFLASYAADAGPFGFLAERTRWAGLDACRRAAAAGDDAPLERYARLMGWLCDVAMQLAGVDVADERQRKRVDQITALRRALAERSSGVEPGTDLRIQSFLGGPRVFAAVTHADSVFEHDPFDVPEVHGDVREVFERLVAQAVTPVRHGDRGRMLLVLGDSGAGKTHLMRAFRSHVHGGGHGFAIYAQLQSRAPEYSRYLLHNVIESLERRYGGPGDEASGLLELARGLPRLLGEDLQRRVARLAEDDWTAPDALAAHVNHLVDELLGHDELARFDPDLLRALLYLLCNDSRITPRVLKYLRCEPMSPHDRHWIGDVEPRTGADEPIAMIKQLARLAFATQQAAFVMMVDQAELAGFDERTVEAFKRAADALYAVVSAVPSTVAVIACLADMFHAAAPSLTKGMIDRLTADPPPAKLASERSAAEITAIVAQRLEWLFSDAGAVFRADEPTFPFPPALLAVMTNRRTRTVLELCHQYQEACSAAGAMLPDWIGGDEQSPLGQSVDGERTGEAVAIDRLAAEWNDLLHGSPGPEIPDPDDEATVLGLLADGGRACPLELGLASVVRPNGHYVEVDLGNGGGARLTIGVTNRASRGGGFGGQLGKLRAASGSRTAVAVRTVEFPTGRASDNHVAELRKAGGRKILCSSSDLQALVAMREFAAKHGGATAFAAWRRRDRPLLGRGSLAELFAIEPAAAPPEPGQAETPPRRPRGTPPPAPETPPPPDGKLQVGTTSGLEPRPHELAPDLLVRHSGVLGSPGSGKTTLALNLIEQLLEREVAVVMVDRKGDLAGYARPDWTQGVPEGEARRRAEALARRLDVRLFTPGASGGRPLSFGVVPSLDGVPEHERGKVIHHATAALCALLRLGPGVRDQMKRAILGQAIIVLAERSAGAGLEGLIDLVDSRDDALVARVSKFDDRLFAALVGELETLRLNESELFDRSAERLSADLLLGRGADRRTPLAIVSTRFLGDTERVQAWISHLFVELSRWCMRAPQPRLQALLMLDEADQYMPAGTVKPPSKEPLMDLLKRARSGGMGVMLATQTPGDLDYKSRDLITSWFVGKIGDNRSIDKVRPLFEKKPALAGKLGQLPAGQFMAIDDASVVEISRRPSLLRTDQLPEHEILALAARRA